MMCRIDNTVKEWEAEVRQPYDSAGKGSSALESALIRNMLAELAHWNNEYSAAILHDFEKFFDTIDIPILLNQAIKNQFPATELSLALQQHLAPRVIQVAGFSAQPIQVYKSILAGCAHSVAMTRNLLLQSVKEVEEHNQPATITKVHVDDTAQFSSHKEAKTLFSNILAAAIHFKHKTTKLKLTLSSKKGAGSVIASSTRLAKEI